MIDLTEFFTNANIGLGLALIALILYLKFFAKFPSKKSSKR